MTMVRDQPYLTEHRSSSEARFSRGKMPHSLERAIRWLMERAEAELPSALHTGEVWRDRVTLREFEAGVQAVGGSHLGTLAWSGLFRLIVEGSSSVTDDEGFYVTPLRSGLSRLSRRSPFMAHSIAGLIGCGGDWHRLAQHNGWHAEMAEVYLSESLRRLWMETYDQTAKAA